MINLNLFANEGAGDFGWRARVACCLLTVVMVSGCKTLDVTDPVDRAKQITIYLNEGDAIMASLNVPTGESRPLEPTIESLDKAAELFGKAAELAPDSFKPRWKLAQALMAAGLEYQWNLLKVEQDLATAEKEGRRPTANSLDQQRQYRAGMTEYLSKANNELDYYSRFLYARQPAPVIYDHMRNNFVAVENYEKAYAMGLRFVQEAKLEGRARTEYDGILQNIREKMLQQAGESGGPDGER